LERFERLFCRWTAPIHQFEAAFGDAVLKIGQPGIIAAADDQSYTETNIRSESFHGY
jgi:hypothetical protein